MPSLLSCPGCCCFHSTPFVWQRRGLAHNAPPSSDLATFLSHQCAESTTAHGVLMPRVGIRDKTFQTCFLSSLGSGGYRTELGQRVRGSSQRSPGIGAQSSSMCQLLKAPLTRPESELSYKAAYPLSSLLDPHSTTLSEARVSPL